MTIFTVSFFSALVGAMAGGAAYYLIFTRKKPRNSADMLGYFFAATAGAVGFNLIAYAIFF